MMLAGDKGSMAILIPLFSIPIDVTTIAQVMPSTKLASFQWGKPNLHPWKKTGHTGPQPKLAKMPYSSQK